MVSQESRGGGGIGKIGRGGVGIIGKGGVGIIGIGGIGIGGVGTKDDRETDVTEGEGEAPQKYFSFDENFSGNLFLP